jgi:putative salt-induced outer membrane protein YdiY
LRPAVRRPVLALIGVLLTAVGSRAEEPQLGWSANVELSLVATSGNSEASSFGLRSDAQRKWQGALWTLEAGALRAEESRFERRAVGASPDDVVLEERSDSVPTAESYFLRSQYDRKASERRLWFGGAGWERDRFAGIDARWSVVAGAGNVWADREELQSRTRYGLTWTREEQSTGESLDFAGARLSWSLLRRLTTSASFTSSSIVDVNLDDTADLRAEELAAIAVTMSDRLALKVSALLKYDHQPALVAVPRFLPDGTPAGDSVLVPLSELDTVLSASLVVSF